MEARHPITNKVIKLVRTNVSPVKDNKTLLYVSKNYKDSNKYGRYTTIISEFEALKNVRDKPHILIIPTNTEYIQFKTYLDNLETINKNVVCVIGAELIEKVKHDQTMVIEELFEYYPFIEHALKARSCIEQIVTAVGYILRFNKIILPKSFESEKNTLLTKWTGLGNKIVYVEDETDGSFIPNIYHIFQYYVNSNTKRQEEIQTALKRNLENEFIDKIILITDKGVDVSKIERNDKLMIESCDHRMNYGETFDLAKRVVEENKEHMLVFSNADISFDDTLRQLYTLKIKEKRLFLALLRYEYNSEGHDHKLFGPRADSQDCWIFSRDNLDFDTSKLTYNYGIPGCDNIITIDMFKNRFVVCNPAYTIKTYHHHASNIRNYHPQKDVLYNPVYMHVTPTHIQPFSILNDFKGVGVCESNFQKIQTHKSYEVKIHTIGKSDDKYSKNYIYTPTNTNELIHFTNKNEMFISYDGLISDYDSIYIGNNKIYEHQWSNNSVSTLTPMLEIPCMIASTMKMEKDSIGKFILHNIPSIMQIRFYANGKYGDEPEFFVPPFEEVNDFLQNVDWPMLETDSKKLNVTINPYREDVQYTSKNIYAHIHNNEIDYSIENIELLRSLFKKSNKKSKIPTVCIVINNNKGLIDKKCGETIEKVHFVKKEGTEEEKRWNVLYLDEHSSLKSILNTLPTIDWLILEEGSMIGDYLYLLRKNTKVCEFRREEHIEGVSTLKTLTGLEQLCGACNVKYIMGVVKYREPLLDQRQNILLDVGKALSKYGFDEIVHMHDVVEKPKIIKPVGKALTGINIHSGDSFREMIDLWKEKDYVEVIESEETPYVWYNKIGDVLLYDRDTNMWFLNDKMHEKINYRFGLFGNSVCPGPHEITRTRQSVWSYWPRYPKLLQSFLETNQHNRSFEERSVESIFLGKIENNVQMKNRTKYDWSSVIQMYECPVDSSGRSYKYTPVEYLEKLCTARFGLSLAGYGPKCHREIEYFACGVVPLVAPECDMDGFLNPPKEGIHYFRVDNPEEIVKIIKETPKDVWERMSIEGKKWYTHNCSPEGLFKLTFERIKQVDPYVGIGLPKWKSTY